MPRKGRERNMRRAAVSSLRAWAKGHDYAATLIDRHARRNRLSAEDRALLQALLSSVLRHRTLLDYWIGQFRRGKLDHETRDILRVGLAQLYLLGIKDHAAVNETVECARSAARGLVNAVLRRAISARARQLSEVENLPLATRYSHPEWLVKRWQKSHGADDLQKLLAWNNQAADVWARVNPLQPSPPAEVLAGWQRHPEAEGFYRMSGAIPHELVESGKLYLQDPATRHAPALLSPQPGETVLDACAAPGGKAALLAASMQNHGRLICTDANSSRLPRLEENLQRLGVRCAEVRPHDWTTPPPREWQEHFDAILLDVPCSNTGVFRRRIDARWRIRPETISELTSIQATILQNALVCLKPTGRLVYSTCSLEREENAELVEQACREHGCTRRAEIDSTPLTTEEDGAYAALLELGTGDMGRMQGV